MMRLELPVINFSRRPFVLSVFAKGVDGSRALNFGRSAGRNCEPSCAHLREGTCYAVKIEKRHDRRGLVRKLVRHETMRPAALVALARLELRKLESVPWFRISTAGSVPRVARAKRSPEFCRQLRLLLVELHSRGIPVHLPVESVSKQEYYAAIANGYATVRVSCHSAADFLLAKGACSATAGRRGDSFRQRLAAAVALAQLRRQRTGRTTVVCPAVIASMRRGAKRVQCGQCRACALPDVDIVYPLH